MSRKHPRPRDLGCRVFPLRIPPGDEALLAELREAIRRAESWQFPFVVNPEPVQIEVLDPGTAALVQLAEEVANLREHTGEWAQCETCGVWTQQRRMGTPVCRKH